MAYNKKTWKDGDVITAEDLNNMEEGIAEAKKEAEQSNTAANEAKEIAEAKAPAYTYGKTDLTDGVSELDPGTLYFMY